MMLRVACCLISLIKLRLEGQRNMVSIILKLHQNTCASVFNLTICDYSCGPQRKDAKKNVWNCIDSKLVEQC